MEETILIEGKRKANVFSYCMFGLGILLFGCSFISVIGSYQNGYHYVHFFGESFKYPNAAWYDSFLEFYFDRFFNYSAWVFCLLALCCIGIGIYTTCQMSKSAISVSDKRIWGKTSFGKKVDLPISSVSAITLGGFSSVAVSSGAMKAKFWLLINKNEVYSTISSLISGNVSVSSTNSIVDDAIESLPKYKELLEKGAITQEEFDQIKKQLLNL